MIVLLYLLSVLGNQSLSTALWWGQVGLAGEQGAALGLDLGAQAGAGVGVILVLRDIAVEPAAVEREG